MFETLGRDSDHHTYAGVFAPPPVLTPKAFHEATHGVIGLNTIYQLLRGNRIRHIKIGSRFLILASEVTAFFERESGLGWSA